MEKYKKNPEIIPIKKEPTSVTPSHPAVIATSPPSIPLQSTDKSYILLVL